MKIAVASENNNVSGHFGHCEGFIIYEVMDGKIMNKDYIQNPPHKPGFLPQYLGELEINVIIAGGMGAMAQTLFKNHGIEVVVGAQGPSDEVTNMYLKGVLVSTQSVCREHQHAGNCQSH